jgi:hypothetical protein
MEIKSPNYYFGKYKKIEAKDVVLDFQEDNYNLGTALTYIMRAGKKPNNPITQDIKKAIHHLQIELEHQIKKSTHNDEPNHPIQEHQGDGESSIRRYGRSAGKNTDWWEASTNNIINKNRTDRSKETTSDSPMVG